MDAPINVIPVIIYAAELAVAAIILFYVVEMLTMPANMKRVCQGLIVLIAILAVIGVLLGSAPLRHPHHMLDRYRRTHRAIQALSGEETVCPPRVIISVGWCAIAAALKERRISGSREYTRVKVAR